MSGGRSGGRAGGRGRRRVSVRSMDRLAASDIAASLTGAVHEQGYEQRWEIITRHALLTADTRRVLHCNANGAHKCAYPTEGAAVASAQELLAVGALTHPNTAFRCTARLFEYAEHWHLRSTGRSELRAGAKGRS